MQRGESAVVRFTTHHEPVPSHHHKGRRSSAHWAVSHGGRRRCRFRDLIVAPSYPFDACHHYRPWMPCRKCQNVVSSFVGERVSIPLASPLAPLVLHMNEGEGCACGPSGSRRNSGYGPPGVVDSLVVWWREAAGIGEAVMMALRCVTH